VRPLVPPPAASPHPPSQGGKEPDMIIAIDGPSAAGKGTLARRWRFKPPYSLSRGAPSTNSAISPELSLYKRIRRGLCLPSLALLCRFVKPQPASPSTHSPGAAWPRTSYTCCFAARKERPSGLVARRSIRTIAIRYSPVPRNEMRTNDT